MAHPLKSLHEEIDSLKEQDQYTKDAVSGIRDRISSLEEGNALTTNLVFNIAELETLDDSLFENGITINVSTLFDSYTLEKTSTEAIDGLLIVATLSGVGRWHRACLPHDHWRRQLEWHINPATGNDEADGSSGTPIKTWAEFMRRHGDRLGSGAWTTVKLYGAIFSENIHVDLILTYGSEVLAIEGEPTVLYSGSISALQEWDSVARDEVQIADASLPVSWTASGLVGHAIIMTSGAAVGAIGWVVKDLGGKTCRSHSFVDIVAGAPVNPSVGDTFDVVSFTDLTNFALSVTTGLGTTLLSKVYVSSHNYIYCDGSLFVWGSKLDINNLYIYGGLLDVGGCLLVGNGGCQLISGESQWWDNVFQGISIKTYDAYTMIIGQTLVQDHGYFSSTGSSGSHQAEGGTFHISADIATFDNDHALIVCGTSRIDANVKLWGTGNVTANAIQVNGDGTLFVNTGVVLDILGSTTSDVYVGGYSCTFTEALSGVSNITNHAKVIPEGAAFNNIVYYDGAAWVHLNLSLLSNTVASISALTALDDTSLPNGAEISVATLFDSYTLEKSSTEAIDGLLIVATNSGTGRYRRRCQPHARWQKQLEWYIDPASGNDEAEGSISAPIKTWAEFIRRHGDVLIGNATVWTVVYVYIIGPVFTEDLRITFDMSNNEALRFVGEREILYSGTIDTIQEWNSATHEEVQITDTSLPVSWTDSNLVGHQILMTSGTGVDGASWVVSDLGSKTCRSHIFYNDNMGNMVVSPSVGDTFDIVSCTTFSGDLYIDVGGGIVYFKRCYLGGNQESFDCYSGTFVTTLSSLETTHIHGIGGCFVFADGTYLTGGGVADLSYGNNLLYGTVIGVNAVINLKNANLVIYDLNLCLGELTVNNGQLEFLGTEIATFTATNSPIKCVTGNIVLDSFYGTHVNLWGTIIGQSHALEVGAGAQISINDTTLNIQGSTVSDVLVGGYSCDFAEAMTGVSNITDHSKILSNTISDNIVYYDGTKWSKLNINILSNTIDNISAFATLDDTSLPNGAKITVSSLFDSYTLEKTSTETIDGLMIVSTNSGVGRWHRSCDPHDHWRKQLNWYIDPINGNDENDGSVGLPIKTWEEFCRRHGNELGSNNTVNVNFIGTQYTGTLDINLHIKAAPEQLHFVGDMSTIYSGSISSYQSWNPVLRNEIQITDNSLPISWTDSGLMGKALIMTSGTMSGAICWIIKDLGGKTCRAHIPYSYATGFGDPSPGDTFDVVNMTDLSADIRIHSGIGAVWFENIDISHNLSMISGMAYFDSCKQKIINSYSYISAGSLYYYGSMLYGSNDTMRIIGGVLELNGCSFVNVGIRNYEGIINLVHSAITNGTLSFISNDGQFNCYCSMACFDNTSSFLEIGNFKVTDDNLILWGTDNTFENAIFINPNGSLILNSGIIFDIQGATSDDVNIGSYECNFATATSGVSNITTGARVIPATLPFDNTIFWDGAAWTAL